MACFKNGTIIDLTTRESLALPDFRGTTLRVTRGTVWITQEHDTQDVVLRAGDTWVVERNGLTLLRGAGRQHVLRAGSRAGDVDGTATGTGVAGGTRVAARRRGRVALPRGPAAGARPLRIGECGVASHHLASRTMPLVTVTLRAGHPPAFKRRGAGRRPRAASWPLASPRPTASSACSSWRRRTSCSIRAIPISRRIATDDFVLIEILWSVGRSVKVKRALLAEIVSALRVDPGVDPEHVMVVFKETQWENWAFGGGRLLHA